jgi:hypothetical protein
LTFACGKSTRGSDPVDIKPNQALNDSTNTKPEDSLDQIKFSTAKYNDAMTSLKELSCKIDNIEGVTTCPEPSSLESADSLYILLTTFGEGVDTDIPPTTDYKLRALLEKSIEIEISKVKASPYLKPLVDDTNSQLGSFKVGCMFGFRDTLGFQKRLVGISLMRDLCSTPDFISELSRLKTNVKLGGLVVSDENKFSYVTTFTRVTIDAEASKAEVLEFLSKQTL